MWPFSRDKQKKIAVFNRVWEECEARGDCDARGGFEYRSIKRSWIKDGYPEPIADYIKKLAN